MEIRKVLVTPVKTAFAWPVKENVLQNNVVDVKLSSKATCVIRIDLDGLGEVAIMRTDGKFGKPGRTG